MNKLMDAHVLEYHLNCSNLKTIEFAAKCVALKILLTLFDKKG